MSEVPEGTTRDVADDGTQESPSSATDGGRSSRGPSLSTSGEQEPGGAVPPYEGRQESASTTDSDPYQDGAHVGGAGGPASSSPGTSSPEPAETPGGAAASPADEMPAGELDDQRDHSHEESDPGVGPAHFPGTTRGEDLA